MRWGLVPSCSWAPDPSIGQRVINARAETLLEKPSFKQLVTRRLCLVPADGFYVWPREGKRKVPMWIHLKNRKPFAFRGALGLFSIRAAYRDNIRLTLACSRPRYRATSLTL